MLALLFFFVTNHPATHRATTITGIRLNSLNTAANSGIVSLKIQHRISQIKNAPIAPRRCSDANRNRSQFLIASALHIEKNNIPHVTCCKYKLSSGNTATELINIAAIVTIGQRDNNVCNNGATRTNIISSLINHRF